MEEFEKSLFNMLKRVLVDIDYINIFEHVNNTGMTMDIIMVMFENVYIDNDPESYFTYFRKYFDDKLFDMFTEYLWNSKKKFLYKFSIKYDTGFLIGDNGPIMEDRLIFRILIESNF